MKKIVLLVFIAFFCRGSAAAWGREAVFSMGYSITKSPAGTIMLTVTTETAEFGPWLGVSLYPPGDGQKKVAGNHQAFPIKEGKWIKEITIPARYLNGTFEIAVWGRHIPREECAPDDLFCQQSGFRLQNMFSYAWGLLTAP